MKIPDLYVYKFPPLFMYNLAINLYFSLVKAAAPFNTKAKLMTEGHKQVFPLLQKAIEKDSEYIWFHAASLGEFEQARPLIEEIRKAHPKYKIIITFYSPSGYEVRKNFEQADVVCYLPPDTKKNVRKFLDIVNPKKVFFIKYEFWANYLTELNKRKIETYIVSAIFRKEQLFFKFYGKAYRNLLFKFNHLFVQDKQSSDLLQSIGITNTTICGDTRFDRVFDIKSKAKELPLIQKFKTQFTIVAGSTWPKDDEIVIKYFNENPNTKLIIAPHEINDEHLNSIISELKRSFLLYSEADEESIDSVDCIIIDCFGLLSSIYRYGDVAYIGGGFGVGIHNTTEAAVYHMPVVFGPNYSKFKEARDLIEWKGGNSINTTEEYKLQMDKYKNNPMMLKISGENAGKYIETYKGATQKILSRITWQTK